MKWLKHYADASRSKKFLALRFEVGDDFPRLYGIYWLILEYIANEYEKEGDEAVDYERAKQFWSNMWGIDTKEIDEAVNIFVKYDLLIQQNGVLIAHKLPEYADNYRKYQKVESKSLKNFKDSLKNEEDSLKNFEDSLKNFEELQRDFKKLNPDKNRIEENRIDISSSSSKDNNINNIKPSPQDIYVIENYAPWCKRLLEDGYDPLLVDYVIWIGRKKNLENPYTYARAIASKEWNITEAKDRGYKPFEIPWQRHRQFISDQIAKEYRRKDTQAWEKYKLTLEDIFQRIPENKRKEILQKAEEYAKLHRLLKTDIKRKAHLEAYKIFKQEQENEKQNSNL